MIGRAAIRLRKYLPRVRGALSASALRLVSRGRVHFVAPVRFIGGPLIWACAGSRIEVGKDVVLVSARGWNPLSPARACSFRAIRAGAVLTIGERLRATGAVVCTTTGISIGDDVLLGSDVLIVDSDFHALNAAKRLEGDPGPSAAVYIGDRVFIGTRSIVLKGVHIGDDAVIGAGSVVSSDVPSGAIAAGVPCRVIGTVDGR